MKGIKAEKLYSVHLLQSAFCGGKESVWNGGALFVFFAAVKCLRRRPGEDSGSAGPARYRGSPGPPGEPGCWPESEGLSLGWGEESGALARGGVRSQWTREGVGGG